MDGSWIQVLDHLIDFPFRRLDLCCQCQLLRFALPRWTRPCDRLVVCSLTSLILFSFLGRVRGYGACLAPQIWDLSRSSQGVSTRSSFSFSVVARYFYRPAMLRSAARHLRGECRLPTSAILNLEPGEGPKESGDLPR